MVDAALILDFHKNSKRQGPGSERDTLRALEFMDLPVDRTLNIADLGCGSGGQTITLAQNLDSQITAVDLFTPFLDELKVKAEKLGLSDKIKTAGGSMDKLSFPDESLDVIWSEGAIYNIGFERGLREWKRYLKVGGYLAVSEITWITNSRPKEIEDFWSREYPAIDLASNKIKILEDCGYVLAGYFYLGASSWIENYYQPMEARFEAFLERNNHSVEAKNLVEEHQREIELHLMYKDFYSYGFYIGQLK